MSEVWETNYLGIYYLALTTSSTTQIPTYSISDAMEPNNLKDNHILDSHFQNA